MPVITEVRLEEYFPGFWFQQVFILLKIMENPKGLIFFGLYPSIFTLLEIKAEKF